jgi:hypothetical protein
VGGFYALLRANAIAWLVLRGLLNLSADGLPAEYMFK